MNRLILQAIFKEYHCCFFLKDSFGINKTRKGWYGIKKEKEREEKY